MKMYLVYIIGIFLMIQGCSLSQLPISGTSGIAADCPLNDFKCIAKGLDDFVEENRGESLSGERAKFMDGMNHPNLTELIESGRIKVSDWSPLWLVPQVAITNTVVLGWAYVSPMNHGGVYGGDLYFVRSLPKATNLFILHELEHFLGYVDRPVSSSSRFARSYTKWQCEKLKEEGLDNWTESSYYISRKGIDFDPKEDYGDSSTVREGCRWDMPEYEVSPLDGAQSLQGTNHRGNM